MASEAQQKMVEREQNVTRHVSPDQPHARLFTLQPDALEKIARGASTHKAEMDKLRQRRG